MNNQNFTAAFSVDQSPEEVFDAINNARGWWSEEIDGRTDKLGADIGDNSFECSQVAVNVRYDGDAHGSTPAKNISRSDWPGDIWNPIEQARLPERAGQYVRIRESYAKQRRVRRKRQFPVRTCFF
jgi:hypothetical protein